MITSTALLLILAEALIGFPGWPVLGAWWFDSVVTPADRGAGAAGQGGHSPFLVVVLLFGDWPTSALTCAAAGVALRPALVFGPLPHCREAWIGGSLVRTGLISEPVQAGDLRCGGPGRLLAASPGVPAAELKMVAPSAAGTVRRSAPGAVQGVLVVCLPALPAWWRLRASAGPWCLLAGFADAGWPVHHLLGCSFTTAWCPRALGHWPAASLALVLPLWLAGAIGAGAGPVAGPPAH